jgi:replicative DNA helicase
VALFSLEMSQDINFFRLLGMKSNKSALDLADGEIEDPAIMDGYGWLADQPMWIYDNQMTCKEIYERTRRLNAKHKLDMIVIDYLQLITGEGSLYENMSEAVTTANRIAKVCKCAVVLVSQLSNETLKAGVKADLPGYKGAGDIVAGVDLGLILERPKTKDGDIVVDELNVKIIKNRHNPSGNTVINLKIDYPSGLISERPLTPGEVMEKASKRKVKKST